MFEEVYRLVQKIPPGKVSTYSIIARPLKIDPQVVGWALHANKNMEVPCHRVVNKEGKLAEGYAFGGREAQRRKLEKEGVVFLDSKTVDLVVCLWREEGFV